MALMKCVTVEVGFEVLHAQASPRGQSLLLPVDPNIELSAPSPAPCLPVCHHVSRHDDNN